ncbi:MAG: exodeoxyribonuclease VII small subunit [Myxococcales bacterium]|nr:exodeoxyribonuclease VII small subunit [Myxococcales bacterium]|tara:strand:+ start:3266 stop:3487 length:222 start_codon:yes stop_codon:yes gene_type:complete
MSSEQSENFEDVLQKLESLVQRLEAGGLPLDEALKLYEDGVRLARAGNTLLEGAENRVEELQATLIRGDEEQT